MSKTLLLRLAGPMQSWGTRSRFSERDTGLEPSKSGVVGLLCAALGKPRLESPADGHPSLQELAELKMGIRVDKEGRMAKDYHTAQNVYRASGKQLKETELSQRYYLADADFLVGLEGPESLIYRLDAALAQPHWQLYLGRKSFVPGLPVRLPDAPPAGPGLVGKPLRAALTEHPWPEGSDQLRLVLETDDIVLGEVRMDQPLDFEKRQFGPRFVATEIVEGRP